MSECGANDLSDETGCTDSLLCGVHLDEALWEHPLVAGAIREYEAARHRPRLILGELIR